MVTSPSFDDSGRAQTVVVPSGLSARYRAALIEALSARAAVGPANAAQSEAHKRVREALESLERLDEKVLGSAASASGAGAAAPLRMLEAAEKKAEQAERDLAEKRVPYEADPLFMYLWNRGFGTGAYRANSLVRYFDRKVARLVGYHGARANYATLLELPVRLREHAARLRTALGDPAAAPEGDREQAPAAGSVDAYRTAIEAADRAYEDARVSSARGDAAGAERIAHADGELAEARASLLAELTRPLQPPVPKTRSDAAPRAT